MVLEFYDLSNAFKILKSSDGNPSYCIASGTFVNEGSEYPIAHLSHRVRNNALSKGVGWIVFDGRNDYHTIAQNCEPYSESCNSLSSLW